MPCPHASPSACKLFVLACSIGGRPIAAFFVVAAPDGRTLATVEQDTRVRLRDAETGRRLRVIA